MISLASPAFTVSLSSSSPIPRPTSAVFTLLYVLSFQRDAHSLQRVRILHKTKHFKPFRIHPYATPPTQLFRIQRLAHSCGKIGGWGEGRPLLGSALFPAMFLLLFSLRSLGLPFNTKSPVTQEVTAQASLAEYTEGAKFRDPGAFDLKIVALDYVLLGDYVDADKWLTRSVEWNSKDSEGWYYLGRAKYNENRFEEAIHAFEQCLKLDAKNVKAEDNLGLSYAGLGRAEEAAAAYRTAIAWQAQSAKKDVGPFIDLGSLLLEQNQPDAALLNLLQAAEIAPQESRAHELLGKAYSHLNQLPKAQAELEKAIALSPQNGPLHYMLGQVYRKEGLNEKAKTELDRAAALNGTRSSPDTPRP